MARDSIGFDDADNNRFMAKIDYFHDSYSKLDLNQFINLANMIFFQDENKKIEF